jgi:hypothetical protein
MKQKKLLLNGKKLRGKTSNLLMEQAEQIITELYADA